MTTEILELSEKIKGLNEYGKRALLITLFDKNIINFPDLSAAYVKSLQERTDRMNEKYSKFLLWAAMYSSDDNTTMGRAVRKYIYEVGAYTGKDGSQFGKKLENEFGIKPPVSDENYLSPLDKGKMKSFPHNQINKHEVV